jgi:hypothetical protein
MTVAGIGVIVSTLGLKRETHRIQIWDEVGGVSRINPSRHLRVITS